MNVLIIGCGFLGEKLGEDLSRMHFVTGTKTHLQHLKPHIHLELLKPATYSKLKHLIEKNDVIVVTAAPSSRNEYRTVYLQLAREIKRALRGQHKKTIIYASSSGVFKEASGNSVYEFSMLDKERAHTLVETEKIYLSMNPHKVVIARFSGLYGETRPLTQMLSSYHEKEVSKRYINLTSQSDAVRFIAYAIKYPIHGIFNFSSKTVINLELYEELFHQKPPNVVEKEKTLVHGGSKKVHSIKLPFLKSVSSQNL